MQYCGVNDAGKTHWPTSKDLMTLYASRMSQLVSILILCGQVKLNFSRFSLDFASRAGKICPKCDAIVSKLCVKKMETSYLEKGLFFVLFSLKF